MSPETAKAQLELLGIAQWLASYSNDSLMARENHLFFELMQSYARSAVKACGEQPVADWKDQFEQISSLKSLISESAHPTGDDGKRNYWVSWYSSDDGAQPPFDAYITGETFDDPPRFTFCALIRADSIDAVFNLVAEHYGDVARRFCYAVGDDYVLSDRFVKA